MITEYIQAALGKARYEIIEDEEPYYGEVSELGGVKWTPSLGQDRGNIKIGSRYP